MTRDHESFRCFWVSPGPSGDATAEIGRLRMDQLPAGDVVVQVAWSSLNYKDAMAATGHPGVAARLPHVPGIDAAGTIVESQSPTHPVGLRVIVTGYELGAGHWGGWSQYIRIPSDWIVPLPPGLTLQQSMMYGTAGFTAAQCVQQLIAHGIAPGSGPVVVTGATGGVGCLAVRLLAQLGYPVTASTGKADAVAWLQELGATEVVSRERLQSSSTRPLLPGHWAGAVDTVGGETLATLIREMKPHGCVTACGLVGGVALNTTVYPFILRGVTLAGITASLCPMPQRQELWSQLAGPWAIEDLAEITTTVDLAELPEWIDRILAGQVRGRVVVRVTGDSDETPPSHPSPHA